MNFGKIDAVIVLEHAAGEVRGSLNVKRRADARLPSRSFGVLIPERLLTVIVL